MEIRRAPAVRSGRPCRFDVVWAGGRIASINQARQEKYPNGKANRIGTAREQFSVAMAHRSRGNQKASSAGSNGANIAVGPHEHQQLAALK